MTDRSYLRISRFTVAQGWFKHMDICRYHVGVFLDWLDDCLTLPWDIPPAPLQEPISLAEVVKDLRPRSGGPRAVLDDLPCQGDTIRRTGREEMA